MAIASLVLGIVSIVLNFIGMGFPVGTICGIVGIVLAGMAKKRYENLGMAKAGQICSIIGLILSLLFFIACTACIGTFGILAGMGANGL